MPSQLHLEKTIRFSVLSADTLDHNNGNSAQNAKGTTPVELPVMKLENLLLHRRRKTTEEVRQQLWRHLQNRGFVVLTLSKSSKPAHIVDEMRRSLYRDFFPTRKATTRNAASLESGDLYRSERGVPMWRCGYELCDDIREAYRVHAGCPDSQPWPSGSRRAWLRGLALCRHICDEALYLTLDYNPACRPGSGMSSWNSTNYCDAKELPDRRGDYSVLYAMHYFNDDVSRQARQSGEATGLKDVSINVKQHVDPSLFVLEPFLAGREGLQVYSKEWLTCDGPSSPIHSFLLPDEDAMILFVGKAFAANSNFSIQPTLHRVVAPPSFGSRRTMIYEQKYEEYFEPPSLD
jgi:isopenicillin N synthase-like dioxygenase